LLPQGGKMAEPVGGKEVTEKFCTTCKRDVFRRILSGREDETSSGGVKGSRGGQGGTRGKGAPGEK